MGVATKRKRKEEQLKGKPYPQNDEYFRIFRSDKVLYRDESGNFKQINNYYYEKEETTFTKKRIFVASFLIFLYWCIATYIYSIIYELTFFQSVFAFGDNYIFLGGITLIIFFTFYGRRGYNKRKGKE